MDRWIVNILCVGLVTGFVTVVVAAPGARASGDSGWLAPVFLETDDTGSATNPKIAVDESGAAIAVWQQFDGSRDNIVTNRFLPGAGWGAPVTVEAKPGWASEPKIAPFTISSRSCRYPLVRNSNAHAARAGVLSKPSR